MGSGNSKVSTQQRDVFGLDVERVQRTNPMFVNVDNAGPLRGAPVFVPRVVPDEELATTMWRKYPFRTPGYAAFPGLGVGLVTRTRTDPRTGTLFYLWNKVHPLEPERDAEVKEFLEVPAYIGGNQVVFPMKYAITQFWPSKNDVEFHTNKGTTFSVPLTDVIQTKNRDILTAVGAIRNDYPRTLDPYFDRRVENPEFATYLDDEGDEVERKRFTTLEGGNRANELYKAYAQNKQSLTPEDSPVLQEPTVRLPTIKSPNKRLRTGFDDLSDFPQQRARARQELPVDQFAEAASKEQPSFLASSAKSSPPPA